MGLKDNIKNELARLDKPSDLLGFIEVITRFNNRFYK